MPQADQPEDRSKLSIYFVPQQLMLQAFQSWQEIVNRYTQDLLSNRQVLDTSGKTLESVMQLKRQADQAMELAISTMQIPTKSDIELLLQKLSTLENLVRDLGDKIDQIIDREQEL